MRWVLVSLAIGLGCQVSSGAELESAGRPDPGDEVAATGDDIEPGGFVRLDADPSFVACDIWAPQCPTGQKCAPHASDPSSSLDSFACVEILGERVPGDSCQIFGDEINSSLDDCERGAWCQAASTTEFSGTCLKHCTGSALDPYCPVASQCLTTSAGPPAVCLRDCHPFDRPCQDPSMACVPTEGGGWACAHVIDVGEGSHGSPCNFANACDPGNACAALPLIPGSACDGSQACCAQLCVLGQDQDCPNFASGEQCLPFYSTMPTPVGYEDVGVCGLAP